MNADEIREMEAGREIDTIVAVELKFYQLGKRSRSIIFADGYELKGFTGKADAMGYITAVCPDFSTDIAAAMQLFELDKFKHFAIDRVDDRSERYQARCATPFNAFSAWGDTAPLAICRAALLTALEYPPS